MNSQVVINELTEFKINIKFQHNEKEKKQKERERLTHHPSYRCSKGYQEALVISIHFKDIYQLTRKKSAASIYASYCEFGNLESKFSAEVKYENVCNTYNSRNGPPPILSKHQQVLWPYFWSKAENSVIRHGLNYFGQIIALI